MLDSRSALAGNRPYARDGLSIREDAGFTLTQFAGFGRGFEKALTAVVGKLPAKIGVVQGNDACKIMRINPQQFWCIGDVAPDNLPSDCLVTPLSSSRSRICVEGALARKTLARVSSVDLDKRSFAPGKFVMTGIHHVPVLIHCAASENFELYVLRTFALSTWDYLIDAALGIE